MTTDWKKDNDYKIDKKYVNLFTPPERSFFVFRGNLEYNQIYQRFYGITANMTKKEYILKVLDALLGYWPLARGLKILVDGNVLDDKTMDSLIDIFAKTIDEIQDGEAKEKIKKSKNILEKIQKIEREQHLRDQKSLDELDELIKEM
jgi:hypothetical protein